MTRRPPSLDGDARSRFAHVRGAFDAGALRELRLYLERVRDERQAGAATDRERRAVARGEASDALRLDARWFDAFRAATRALHAALGSHVWVVYPPQVRTVRSVEHAVPWHQDVGYQRLLGARGHARHVTCFVPLDDDPARRPTVEFLCTPMPEAAHAPQGGFGAGLALAPSDAERTRFALAPGDALVFGDLVVHRTCFPPDALPERRSLEFRLVRPDDALEGKDYFDLTRAAFTRRTPILETA
ncbi:MAG: phytanoyl-CoA dioxygenase family protein [Thermodesulfobacteriota bacterium]